MRSSKTILILVSVFIAGSLLLDRTALEWHAAAGTPGTVSAAVNQFCTEMASSPATRHLMHLTTGELRKAVDQHRRDVAGLPRDVVEVLQQISKNDEWPEAAHLGHVTDFGLNVRCIRLRIIAQDRTSWAFAIREVPIDPALQMGSRQDVEKSWLEVAIQRCREGQWKEARDAFIQADHRGNTSRTDGSDYYRALMWWHLHQPKRARAAFLAAERAAQADPALLGRFRRPRGEMIELLNLPHVAQDAAAALEE